LGVERQELDKDLLLVDAYDAVHDAVYVKDTDGHYLMVNARGAAGIGLEPDQIVGKTDREIFPANADAVRRDDLAVMTTGGPSSSEQVLVVDGEPRTYMTTKAALRDGSGAIIGLIGTSTDITGRIAAEEKLREREAALSEALAVGQMGGWELDMVSGVLSWSDEMYEMFGVDRSTFELTFASGMDLVHPEDREGAFAEIDAARQAGEEFEHAHRIVRPDGEVRELISRARVFRGRDGTALRMAGASLDLTEEKRSRARLESREQLLSLSEELSQVGSFEWDVAANRVTWSHGLCRVFGFELRSEEAGTIEGYLEVVPPEDRSERRRVLDQVAKTGLPAGDEFRIVRPDGKVRWIASRITALTPTEGGTARLVGACQDITERKLATLGIERDLQHARTHAFKDPLTGLASRPLFLDRLNHALDLAKRRGSTLTVLSIDIDGFKALNAQFGNLVGDAVLVDVGSRLRGAVRTSDSVARIGGDRFVVVCEDAGTHSEAPPMVTRLLATFAMPFEAEGTDEPLPVTLSIGITSAGEGSVPSAAEMVERADAARKQAKRRGPGNWGRYAAQDAPLPVTGASVSDGADVLRLICEQIGAADCEQWLRSFHAQVEYLPGVTAFDGFDPIYRGHDGMRRLHAQIQRKWEAVDMTPLRIEQRDDRFAMSVLASLVPRGTGVKMDVSFHQGGLVRDGLVVRVATYSSREAAFEDLANAD
jgi:diguanylate cyclase (GGDEF)-like protein/PAS domain S-box-containing protein